MFLFTAAYAGAWLAERAVLVALICWLFPGKPHPPRDLAPLPPMSRDEKRLAWLLAVVLAMGDRELARRRPGVDRPGGGCDHAAAAGGLYQRRGVCQRVNMRTCIYVAGILGSDRRHPNRDWRRGGQCAAAGDAPDKDNLSPAFSP